MRLMCGSDGGRSQLWVHWYIVRIRGRLGDHVRYYEKVLDRVGSHRCEQSSRSAPEPDVLYPGNARKHRGSVQTGSKCARPAAARFAESLKGTSNSNPEASTHPRG